MAQGEVDVELWRKIAVAQAKRMVILTVEERITLTDVRGIGIIEIRIKIPNARAVDAHVVPQSQV